MKSHLELCAIDMRTSLNKWPVLLTLGWGVACGSPQTSQVAPDSAASGPGTALQAEAQLELLPIGSAVERRLSLMGTWLSLEVDAGSRGASLLASEAAIRALESTEVRLSTWNDRSELWRLNQAPVGQPFALSAELEAELRRAAGLWESTDGAFDPGVGALLEAWGVRTGGRVPSLTELFTASAPGGFRALELGVGTATRGHAGLQLEEGGFGKGSGLDLALAALQEHGARSAFLDLGGQVLVYGEAQKVGLAHPKDRERALLALRLSSGSLATSGNSERGFQVDGVSYSHLIDPRSGRPAPDFGSLSVWAESAFDADALSTGLYVLGPEKALAWAEDHAGIEVIVLRMDKHGLDALATSGCRGRLTSLDPMLQIQFSTPKTTIQDD